MRYLLFSALSGIMALVWQIAVESVRWKNKKTLFYVYGILMLWFLAAALVFAIIFSVVIFKKIGW